MKTYQLARISRRAALRVWMAGAAPLLLIGALGKTAEAALERSPWASLGGEPGGQSDLSQTSLPSCVITPQQTEGPYFVDERLNRSDIRSDPSDGTVAEGAPLRLALQVSQVTGGACAPLAGA